MQDKWLKEGLEHSKKNDSQNAHIRGQSWKTQIIYPNAVITPF